MTRLVESTAISRRRTRFRPEIVRVLLVGESAPAGGTHYYLANSILFSAVREAFVTVYGSRTPSGDDLLRFARDTGVWLIDLAVDPVNALDKDERRRLVRAGGSRVTRQIRQARPQVVVSIKATIAGAVGACVKASGISADFVALPFPVMQWRRPFVAGLATVLRRSRLQGRGPTKATPRMRAPRPKADQLES
jgi:hypothetical protein